MDRLQYFRELRDHLKNTVEGVRYVARWNNQMLRMTEHQAFDTPAIFIRFQPVNHSNTGGGLGIQEYDLGVSLYCFYGDFTGDGEKVEEFIQKVYIAAHRFVPSDELKTWGKLLRVGENEDEDYDQLQVQEIMFNAHVVDYSADNRYTKTKQLTENISVSKA